MLIAAEIPKNPSSKAKFSGKKKPIFGRRFYTLNEQKYSNLRPLLTITFPKVFQNSKKLGHWTSGSGCKKTLNRSEQRKKSVKAFFDTVIFHIL